MKITSNNLVLTEEQQAIVMEANKNIKKYNQAAIILGYGGGKSYIAARIIFDKLKTRDKLDIIWISTKNSLENTRSLLEDKINNMIQYISFTDLSRNINYVDTLNIKKVDLIIIDEAHHALAKQRGLSLDKVLRKYRKATIIGMTANKQRYSDNKKIFEYLTPKLVEGVDYKVRDAKYCIENKLVCDFVYKMCDIHMLKTYYNIVHKVTEDSPLYDQFKDIIEEANSIIHNYEDNTYYKLGMLMRQDLIYDGTTGDRWFVFFPTITELKEHISNIKNMYEIAYDNKNININIIEYHSKISEEESQNLKYKLNSVPNINTVDVILTCNKGSESLHPVNTRGIVMLRKTLSEIVAGQQLGRALKAADFSDGTTFVYDFVNNRDRLASTKEITSITGKFNIDEINRVISNSDVSKYLDKLKKNYDIDFEAEILDEDVEHTLNQLKLVKELFEIVSDTEELDSILKKIRKVDDYNNINKHGAFLIYQNLLNYDSRNNTNIAQKYVNVQDKFIDGFFGEYKVDDVEVNNIYQYILDTFGNLIYIPKDTEDYRRYSLIDLTQIADEVKSYEYDYKNRISHTKKLKEKIMELRTLNLEGKLCATYMKFCLRNKIDIDGIYSNIINEVLSSEEINKFMTVKNLFKRLVRDFSSLDQENIDESLNILAKEHIFTIMCNKNKACKQASIAIKIKYKELIDRCNKYVDREDYTKCNLLISSILKVESFINSDNYDSEYYLKIMALADEMPILELVKRHEENILSNYELYVLENLGIRVLSNRRNTSITSLISKIPFGIVFDKFTKEPSEKNYNKLKIYKQEILPKYAQKMLKTHSFKVNKEVVETELLFNKDNNKCKDIVSQLFFYDKNKVNTIIKMINNGEVGKYSILKYSIPEKLYSKCSKQLDIAMLQGLKDMSVEDKRYIEIGLKNNNSCFEDIIEVLIESNLIPEEQLELARYLIEIAS